MRKKIIFIGNSIVAGYPWSKGKSFPSIVRKTLKGEPPEGSGLSTPAYAEDTGFDIINKGINGDTTAGIAARFAEDVLAHSPDMAFYLTGANDFIYREATPEEAFDNLQALASASDAKGITTVYITPLPVDAGKAGYMWLAGCGVSYDAVNRQLEEFSQMLRSCGRPFVDMNSRYQDFIDEVGDVDLAYLDGVHPTPAGHEFIAGQVLALIDKENLYK